MLCAGIVGTCLIYLITGLIFKPIVNNDALYGMISLDNYLNGVTPVKHFTTRQDWR